MREDIQRLTRRIKSGEKEVAERRRRAEEQRAKVAALTEQLESLQDAQVCGVCVVWLMWIVRGWCSCVTCSPSAAPTIGHKQTCA